MTNTSKLLSDVWAKDILTVLDHEGTPLILDHLVKIIENLIDNNTFILYLVHVFEHGLDDFSNGVSHIELQGQSTDLVNRSRDRPD
jgi:hypothetical protein